MSGFIYARNALIALSAFLLPAIAHADPIPGLYNTGLDENGNRIAQGGGNDAHYRVNGRAAVTYYHSSYYSRSDAQWIGELPDGNYTQPLTNGVSTTYYTLTFDLTGLNPASAHISGQWGVDNHGLIYINGILAAENANGFYTPLGFNITSGFQPGVNTITFQIDDYGPPAAFIVHNISGTASKSQPPAWTVGSYGAWSSSCGNATRTRPVTCINPDNGAVLDDQSCNPGTRPSATDSSYQTSGCGYEWEAGQWGAAVPACGETTQSRTVQCKRTDGQYVEQASCDSATRPSETQTTTNHAACSFTWTTGTWSTPSTMCGSATQSRSVKCMRTDGAEVADASCTDPKPASSQQSQQTAGCGYAWDTGEWSQTQPACGDIVSTRSVTCVRTDGETVDDASCTEARPASSRTLQDYRTCSYGWTVGEWTQPTTTCGPSTESRTVTCRRSEGTTVSDDLCAGDGTKPEGSRESHQTSGCGYEWQTGPYGSPVPACGSTTATRTVSCRRTDGQTVADGMCTSSSRPVETMQTTDYSACYFSWSVGEWTTPASCGQVTRTRPVTCTRSDGSPAADNQCGIASRPVSSEQVEDTATCTYSWQQAGTGPWSECAGGTQARSVSYACRRNDGANAAETLCTAPRPSAVETRSCTAQVPTQPEIHEGDVVIFRRPVGATRN